jgi:hypothetical protein
MRVTRFIVLFALCLLVEIGSVSASPLEETVSQRQSIRSYTTESISFQQLLSVLWAAYGYSGGTRVVPQIGPDYSLIIFPVNATGSYTYIPETNSLTVYDSAVNKETIRPHDQGWPSNASYVLVVVWNQTKMNNGYFASAEAGCLVQNTYLAAVSLGLGTCCVGGIDSQDLSNDLRLPTTLTPLLVMPLSYPASAYPPAAPAYSRMTGNLPLVQYSQLSFASALNNMIYTQAWSGQSLSQQELSQLLWASYGYSNTTHRTTPSAYDVYPLVVYVSNATGTYQYTPQNHSVTEVQAGDKRLDIANACGNQVWAANAPAIFLVAYNSSYNGGNTGDGGALPHEFIEVDAGAVVQQLFLEASAWNLSANIVSNGLEEWNGTGAAELRNILNLSFSLIPLYIVPVGHEIGYNLNIRVKDWDLIDCIQGAYVYMNSEWKISDENGWANWTDVSGTVAINVKWFGIWVNGTFTVKMDSSKTIDIRCNIFDIIVTCIEGQRQAFLQYANVTVFAGGNKIQSGITGKDGKVHLANVPNSTLTFVAYDANNEPIANVNRTITSEEQNETITCDKNFVTTQMEWKITEVWEVSSLFLPFLPIAFIYHQCLKQRNKTLRCKHTKKKGGDKKE